MFAEYHVLPRLERLAVQRMIQTLRNVDCTVEHVAQELSETIKYVYDRTITKGDDKEPMRKLLSQFAAVNYTLHLHGSFEKLIACGGDFTLDLGQKLAQGNTIKMEEDELYSLIEELRKPATGVRRINQAAEC